MNSNKTLRSTLLFTQEYSTLHSIAINSMQCQGFANRQVDGCKTRNVLLLLYFCYDGHYSLLVQAPLVVFLVLDGVALLRHPVLVG